MQHRTPSRDSIARLDRRVLDYYLEWARTRFWLIPASMCGLALLAAVGSLYLDRWFAQSLGFLPALPLDADAARSLMGVLATSVISLGGVSFSITMVALSLTSGQYGPKVMRHFLSSVDSKFSLGMFFSTAVFALTVLVGLGSGSIPRLSVLLALLLAGSSLIEFMRFIHRTTSDLQADQIIQRLGHQLRTDLQRLVSDSSDNDPVRTHDTRPWRRAAKGLDRAVVGAFSNGYIQTIDYPGLVAKLADTRSVALLRARPGDFLIAGYPILTVWGHAGQIDPQRADALASTLTTGDIRTSANDPDYPITQIQQIAARALSPGINDPGTAISCIDSLTLALGEVIDADFPGTVWEDDKGAPRLLVPQLTIDALVYRVFASPRRWSAGNLEVVQCLLESLTRLMHLTMRPDRLRLLKQQADLLVCTYTADDFSDSDLDAIRQRYLKLCRLCR